VQLSRRSQQKFADLAAGFGTVRGIEDVYEAHGFDLPAGFVPTEGRARRSVCEAAEAGVDLSDATVSNRLLRVYLDGVDDWGRRTSIAFGPLAGDEDPLLLEARGWSAPSSVTECPWTTRATSRSEGPRRRWQSRSSTG
jgi:hypothetical protein